MPHATPLISTLVGGFVLAFLLGAIAHRFRLPPLVGYLVAGVLVGPYTPGFVADQNLAPELAEIGVILLMFGVGLHFSLKDLLSVRGIAVPGAIVQIGFATLLGWAMGLAMGWPTGGSLVFGLALSVASTVVLLKALQERRMVETAKGRIAVGWLIVEDLAMVLALVLIPAVASVGNGERLSDPLAVALVEMSGLDIGVGGLIALTLLKVALFVALMLVFGRKIIPSILHRVAHTGSRELFRLGVLAIALGVAFGASQLFGVSLALGAFFAGMVLSESELSHSAARESLPLRDAFSVLFFVSVGMLFDPTIVLREPLAILATVFIIVIGKSAAAFLIVILFRKGVATALTISASLAQIGEFSFILAELGVGLKLLPEEGRDFILAGAILSIVLNPLMFYLTERLRPRLEDAAARRHVQTGVPQASSQQTGGGVIEDDVQPAEAENQAPISHDGHCVLVGYGRVGRIVAANLKTAKIPFVVIEESDALVSDLHAEGIDAIAGHAASPGLLALANISRARSLVVAIPDAFEDGNIVESANRLNERLLIIARAHSDAEVDHLTGLGADTVIMGEREIANGMLKRLDQILHSDMAEPGPVV